MVVVSTFLTGTVASQILLAGCAGALVYAVVIGRRVSKALHGLYDLLGELDHHVENQHQELRPEGSGDDPSM